jgi:hypothetical protein
MSAFVKALLAVAAGMLALQLLRFHPHSPSITVAGAAARRTRRHVAPNPFDRRYDARGHESNRFSRSAR